MILVIMVGRGGGCLCGEGLCGCKVVVVLVTMY